MHLFTIRLLRILRMHLFILLIASFLFCTCSLLHHSKPENNGGITSNAGSSAAERKTTRTTMELAVIMVDCPEGRKPDGSLPDNDADTSYFPGDSINAVGAMGWVLKEGASGEYVKKIRKYVYEDYWNKFFSIGTYYDDSLRNIHPHPDYTSHGIRSYGSMCDYYTEVSYGNYTIVPARTWPGESDRYHAGIVNRFDEADGKKYIRWIKLGPRSRYLGEHSGFIIADAVAEAKRRHRLSPEDGEYLAFDIDHYGGTVVVMGAGSNVGGYSPGYGVKGYAVSEKEYYTPNRLSSSTFDGILSNVHEFAHATLALHHMMIGSFDPMHWGGMAPRCNYCPPHFNPATKIQMGWIAPANIIEIDSSTEGISLRPSHLRPVGDEPTFAVIKIEGSGHRKISWGRSEYFLLEYRTREGFNRYSGGTELPASSPFRGGVLIWHYSSLVDFPYGGEPDVKVLSIEAPGYGPNYPHAKDQSPADYFTPGTTFQTTTPVPTKRGIAAKSTRVIVGNISYERGKLGFDVQVH